MSVETVMEEVLGNLPQGMAVGYVDMVSGSLLAVRTVNKYPSELFEELASLFGEILQGSHIVQAEDIVDRVRGKERPPGTHYFNDMILLTDHTLHIFLRGKENPDHGLVFVCMKDANIGMAFHQARQARERIEAEALIALA